jgi:hypothetical protein
MLLAKQVRVFDNQISFRIYEDKFKVFDHFFRDWNRKNSTSFKCLQLVGISVNDIP